MLTLTKGKKHDITLALRVRTMVEHVDLVEHGILLASKTASRFVSHFTALGKRCILVRCGIRYSITMKTHIGKFKAISVKNVNNVTDGEDWMQVNDVVSFHMKLVSLSFQSYGHYGSGASTISTHNPADPPAPVSNALRKEHSEAERHPIITKPARWSGSILAVVLHEKAKMAPKQTNVTSYLR
jgi:hypothetical protein